MAKIKRLKVKIRAKCPSCCWGGYRSGRANNIHDRKPQIGSAPCPRCGGVVVNWGGIVNFA